MSELGEDEFKPPDPPKGVLGRLKHWFYDDDRISTAILILLFSSLGAASSLLSGLAVVLLGERSLIPRLALHSTLTLFGLLGGLGLLFRQRWSRGVALGVVAAYVLYTVAQCVFVPGEGVTLARVCILAGAVVIIVQLPNTPVTQEEERAALQEERALEAIRDVLDRADEILAKERRAEKERRARRQSTVEALGALSLEEDHIRESIATVGSLFSRGRFRPSIAVRANAECAARATQALLDQGHEVGEVASTAVSHAIAYVNDECDGEVMIDSCLAARDLWMSSDPESPEANIARIAAGSGSPDPESGTEDVLLGIVGVFPAEEARELVRWHRERLTELLKEAYPDDSQEGEESS